MKRIFLNSNKFYTHSRTQYPLQTTKTFCNNKINPVNLHMKCYCFCRSLFAATLQLFRPINCYYSLSVYDFNESFIFKLATKAK